MTHIEISSHVIQQTSFVRISSAYARGRLTTAEARQLQQRIRAADSIVFIEFEWGKTNFSSLQLSNAACRLCLENWSRDTTLSRPQLEKSTASPPQIHNGRKHLLPSSPIGRVEKPVQRRPLVVQLLLRDRTVIKNRVAVHAFFSRSHGHQTEGRSTTPLYRHKDRCCPLQPVAAARQAK